MVQSQVRQFADVYSTPAELPASEPLSALPDVTLS